MAISPFLFRLKPAGPFFFGGERSFGYDGERAAQNVNANYFVQSNRYPQQTTLLGVLRYKLLEANGWLAKKGRAVPPEANAWIGERSFRSAGNTTQSFGHIHGLSPLFWLRGGTPYLMAPFDWGLSWQWAAEGGRALLESKEILPSLPKAVGYDPKQGIRRQLINRHGEICSLEEVHVSQTQEGILKKTGPTGRNVQADKDEDEQGFYKQTYYRFKTDEWAFAFVAYLADEAADKLADHLKTNGWATVGGEGRPFRVSMEPVVNVGDLLRLPNQPPTGGPARLTLLSDACVSNEIYQHCAFAVSETVDFRAIETSVRVTNYANLNRTRHANPTIPQRGAQKQWLLERGSVLYVRDGQADAVCQLLNQPQHFCQIGYNAYSLMGGVSDQILFTPKPQ